MSAQKAKMQSDLREYTEAMFDCFLKNPATGIELCMRAWWATQGWEWPWVYPVCDMPPPN